MIRLLGCVLAVAFALCAQITPAKVLQKSEPTYTQQALAAQVQGTVVFEVVVDEHGDLKNATILSPLGFGLDERAQSTIEQWKFRPAMKDGTPVKQWATIEVNFRLVGLQFDAALEQRRTSFNLALRSLQRGDAKQKERAVKSIEDLAHHKFPPAMYAWGRMLRDGDLLPKDAEQGLALISKAADKKYGPALYDIGRTYLDGQGAPRTRIEACAWSAMRQFSAVFKLSTSSGYLTKREPACRAIRIKPGAISVSAPPQTAPPANSGSRNCC